MKKIIFLFLCLYSLAFGIIDFNEVNWGDSKSNLDLIFPKLKEEPSLYPDMKIYAFENPIDQKFNGLTLRGNSLKFVPNISTSVYYKGIDTIDEVGKMIDSNLIIEYVDATKE